MRASLLFTGSPQSRCSLATPRNRSLMCRSGAYAPCAYPRICSNCASACFHILGFIASIAKQSSLLCRRAATQMLAGQWIPTCAGMTIEKNIKIKKLKNLSSRGPGPAKTSVFVGGCRHRDPGNLYRRVCGTTFTTNHFNT